MPLSAAVKAQPLYHLSPPLLRDEPGATMLPGFVSPYACPTFCYPGGSLNQQAYPRTAPLPWWPAHPLPPLSVPFENLPVELPNPSQARRWKITAISETDWPPLTQGQTVNSLSPLDRVVKNLSYLLGENLKVGTDRLMPKLLLCQRCCWRQMLS